MLLVGLELRPGERHRAVLAPAPPFARVGLGRVEEPRGAPARVVHHGREAPGLALEHPSLVRRPVLVLGGQVLPEPDVPGPVQVGRGVVQEADRAGRLALPHGHGLEPRGVADPSSRSGPAQAAGVAALELPVGRLLDPAPPDAARPDLATALPMGQEHVRRPTARLELHGGQAAHGVAVDAVQAVRLPHAGGPAGGPHPAGVDVQGAHPVGLEVAGHRAQKRLPGEHDGLLRRLEPCPPAVPPLGLVGDRLGAGVLVVALGQGFLHPRPVPALYSVATPDGLGVADLVGLDLDRVPHRAGLGVQGLGHVEALGEPLAEHPGQLVADLEPGVLYRTGEPVVGPGAAERHQVAARLEHAERGLRPLEVPGLHLRAGAGGVPLAAHECQQVGRVAHHRVHAVRLERGQDLEAVAEVDGHRREMAAGARLELATVRDRAALRCLAARLPLPMTPETIMPGPAGSARPGARSSGPGRPRRASGCAGRPPGAAPPSPRPDPGLPRSAPA